MSAYCCVKLDLFINTKYKRSEQRMKMDVEGSTKKALSASLKIFYPKMEVEGSTKNVV